MTRNANKLQCVRYTLMADVFTAIQAYTQHHMSEHTHTHTRTHTHHKATLTDSIHFSLILACVGAQYRLADRHSSQIAAGSPPLSWRSPATAIQSRLQSYLCVEIKMWAIIQTRSYGKELCTDLPLGESPQLYRTIHTYTIPLPPEGFSH